MPPPDSGKSLITLDRACELARTGDIWVFRGSSGADRAIRGLTNSPVNHVGMAIVVDDLPPMMWHAELGRSLLDLWTGQHQRGVQLHDMRDAVLQWGHRYGQRGWLRQLKGPVARQHEDGALRAVARLDGTPFPSTARLTGRWLWGRTPQLPWRRERDTGPAGLETAYCAEVVALTYEEMGLLPRDRRPNWYDPGRFWSGDDLELAAGFRLGGEIEVALPPAPGTEPVALETAPPRPRWRRAWDRVSPR
ncbi:hypothetical protein GCM10017691_33620 [Pseudonocardia petroleophila]|uniref:hypothetical protein n=1 Tax=Pseudonocardia petroleophila TaxID=37331 RepID=UPI002107C66E|nr:hypothetical protein [Pseudonocardia petroleophila]